MNYKLALVFFLSTSVSAKTSFVQDDTYLKSLEQRITEMEQQQREFELWYNNYYILSNNRVTPFLGEKISFGGFFESALTHLEGPDTPAMTSSHSHALGINLAADFNDDLRLVTQHFTVFSYDLQNPHNHPQVTPSQRGHTGLVFGSFVAHAYLEFRKNEAINLQTGIGYVPFGIAFQQREPFLQKRRQGPQMTAGSDMKIVGIAFPLWMGLNISGAFAMESNRLGYNIYSFSPSSNKKSLGIGSRLWFSNSQNFKFGASVQSGQQLINSYYSYGFDIAYKHKDFELVSEYARNVSSGGTPELESYYFEPSYEFKDGEWVVYVVTDYFKNPNHEINGFANGYERWANGMGFNWLPVTNVRLRLGGLIYDYVGATDSVAGQKRDFYSIDLSAGIAF